MKKILLAEDDLDDQEIFSEVILEINPDIKLIIVNDGEDVLTAMESLSADELPELIILDQNMPRIKGNETISLLRGKESFKRIPAIIYSTYLDSNFANFCKNQNIGLFLKPDSFAELKSMVEKLIKFYSR